MINGISRKFGVVLAVAGGLLGGGLGSSPAMAAGDFANVVAVCGTIDYSGSVGLTVPMTMDIAGNLCGNGSGGTSSGAFGNNSDSSTPVATGLSGSKSFNYAYDPTGVVWNRLTINPTASNVAVPNTKLINSLVTFGITTALSSVLSTTPVTGFTNADAIPTNTVGFGLDTNAINYGFNGTTYDRVRNNVDSAASILTLTAQAPGTVNSSDQTNFNGRGVKLGINVTADSAGTALVVVTIQGKDTVSGQYYTILSSASIAAVGFSTLTVYPAITATANVAASDVLPRTWRVSVTVSGAGTATATVGSSTIL